MTEWYSASLASDDHASTLCDQAGIPELYKQKFLDYLPRFRDAQHSDQTFDKTHGFYIAVTQGFFGRFHYVRGAMLSQIGSAIDPYTVPWTDVLPELLGSMKADNRIVENYSSGVYIAASRVAQLLVDIRTDPTLQAALAPIFPGEHLSILVTALHEAEQLGVGVLEATEIIEPNPLDLESTFCLTNLFNCDTAGPMLYRQTTHEQMGGIDLAALMASGKVDRIKMDVDLETGTVTSSPAPTRTGPAERAPTPATGQKPRRGLFGRLRGSK